MTQLALFERPANHLSIWLADRFPEVPPEAFYRELFPVGSLARAGERVTGKYRGVAIRLDGKGNAKRFYLTDELELLDDASRSLEDGYTWYLSPVSYAGRAHTLDAARHLYAVAIDLDGIRLGKGGKANPWGFEAMWNQITHDIYPRPTYIVSSGTGLHLYYLLTEPLCMYKNVVAELKVFRRAFTKKTWSSYVTDLWRKIQYESVTQDFRMVGTRTKAGNDVVRAFRTGWPVSIEYLNRFVPDECQMRTLHFKTEMPLAEARERFPDWYEKRIIRGERRGTWQVKRDLYDWWLRRLNESHIGHRYFYIMSLAIYAKKSGIDEAELHRDAWEKVVPKLREQDTEGNRLTNNDVTKALTMYDADYQTFPRHRIEDLTAIPIPANKRNHRTRSDHLKIARFVRDLNRDEGNAWWATGNRDGAPTKRGLVRAWREANPSGRKIDCERALGISRSTVLKWWEN